MHFRTKSLCLAIASAALLTLVACGGGSSSVAGGSSSGGGSTSTSLSGTAAVGAPISGTVVAIDVNGRASPPATTSAAGAFIVDVSGMTAPFILNIVGTANGKAVSLNSVATAAGQTVNITPLTDLIVSTASGRPGGSSLAALCAPTVTDECKAALAAAATPDKLNAAVAAVTNMIAPLNTAGTNPLTGSFKADGTGLDAVLDQILVTPAAAQNAQATITLIATNTTIGSVTLPATAGQTSTTVATAPSSTQITQAQASSTVLSEVKACMATFNALYTSANIGSLDSTTVAAYIDDGFKFGAQEGKAEFVEALTSDLAYPGFALDVVGLSGYNMSVLNSTEIGNLATVNAGNAVRARTSGAIEFSGASPVSAWVKFHPTADAGVVNWKMVKGSGYTGCPGGWKIAGSNHIDMHMNPRITRSGTGSSATYAREWAFHVGAEQLSQESSGNISTVAVRGRGLSEYGGPTTPVLGDRRVTLTIGADLALEVAGGGSNFYQGRDAIQSCQDLAAAGIAKPTTSGQYISCMDESVAAPGTLYGWELRNSSNVALQAFAFELPAVPLSKAFVEANASNLFATLTSKAPATLADIAGATTAIASNGRMDNIFTYNYTQGSAYGSKMDNCRINLNGNAVLAEQPAVGKESSCTFDASAEGTLNKQSSYTAGFIGLTTMVLGNQATLLLPY